MQWATALMQYCMHKPWCRAIGGNTFSVRRISVKKAYLNCDVFGAAALHTPAVRCVSAALYSSTAQCVSAALYSSTAQCVSAALYSSKQKIFGNHSYKLMERFLKLLIIAQLAVESVKILLRKFFIIEKMQI